MLASVRLRGRKVRKEIWLLSRWSNVRVLFFVCLLVFSLFFNMDVLLVGNGGQSFILYF